MQPARTTVGKKWKKKPQHIKNSSGHATAPYRSCSSATPSYSCLFSNAKIELGAYVKDVKTGQNAARSNL